MGTRKVAFDTDELLMEKIKKFFHCVFPMPMIRPFFLLMINARIFHSRDDGPECVIRADAQSILLTLPLHGTRDKLVVPVRVEG